MSLAPMRVRVSAFFVGFSALGSASALDATGRGLLAHIAARVAPYVRGFPQADAKAFACNLCRRSGVERVMRDDGPPAARIKERENVH